MARPRTNIPTKPNDVRAQRSIKALQQALLNLLEDKPLDQILIKEITKAAGVSNQTFFRRFASKEDLLEQVATNEIRHLLLLGEDALSSKASESSAAHMCAYVADHRKLWRVLLNGGAAAAMREEFMRLAHELSNVRPRRNPWIPMELAVPFVASGLFEILAWWMRQPEDYPIENVITIFNALIVDNTVRRRDISLVTVSALR